MAKLRDGRKPGFFWADNRVIDEYGPRMGPNGIAVYMCIARHANQTRAAFPSFAKIAEELGIHKRTVMRAVSILRDLGLIEVVANKDKSGRSASNTYRLLDPPEPGLFDPPQPESADAPKQGDGDYMPPPSDTGVTPLKRTRPREQDPKEQEARPRPSATAKPQPPASSELTPEWLARQWCFHLKRRDRLRLPADTEYQAAEAFTELIRIGITTDAILAGIEDSARDRFEFLGQFRDRLKRDAGLWSKRPREPTEKERVAKVLADREARRQRLPQASGLFAESQLEGNHNGQ